MGGSGSVILLHFVDKIFVVKAMTPKEILDKRNKQFDTDASRVIKAIKEKEQRELIGKVDEILSVTRGRKKLVNKIFKGLAEEALDALFDADEEENSKKRTRRGK